MGALDQFAKFCAMIAGGFTARPSPERERNDGGGNGAAAASSSQATAQPPGRGDDRPHPPRVSHPAAWPR